MKVPGIEDACLVCGLPRDWPRGHPKCRVELIGPAELNTIRARVRSALGVNKYARLDWDTMFRLLGHIAALSQLKSAREIVAAYIQNKVIVDDGSWSNGWPTAYMITDAILAALDAGGFAVVPKEPTPEMLTAMHDAWDYFDANSDVFRREYKAALAASNPKEEGK